MERIWISWVCALGVISAASEPQTLWEMGGGNSMAWSPTETLYYNLFIIILKALSPGTLSPKAARLPALAGETEHLLLSSLPLKSLLQ